MNSSAAGLMNQVTRREQHQSQLHQTGCGIQLSCSALWPWEDKPSWASLLTFSSRHAGFSSAIPAAGTASCTSASTVPFALPLAFHTCWEEPLTWACSTYFSPNWTDSLNTAAVLWVFPILKRVLKWCKTCFAASSECIPVSHLCLSGIVKADQFHLQVLTHCSPFHSSISF